MTEVSARADYALRAFGPTVLETVTLADIVSGELWLPLGQIVARVPSAQAGSRRAATPDSVSRRPVRTGPSTAPPP